MTNLTIFPISNNIPYVNNEQVVLKSFEYYSTQLNEL